MIDFSFQTILWLLLHGVIAIGFACHALIRKRDSRSAFGWMAVCLLLPFLGSLLYFLFGINRVEKRARRIGSYPLPALSQSIPDTLLNQGFEYLICNHSDMRLRSLKTATEIEPLHNGSKAYPAMLSAIHDARTSIVLSSYIFAADDIGRQFVDALSTASDRGVAVYVLVDGVGTLYSFPRITRLLKKTNVHYRTFLPLRLIPPSVYLNLRNHRKILVVDRHIAFTGGMNIGDRHLPDAKGHFTADVQFRLCGRIADDLYQLFWQDWLFATGEPAPTIQHPPRPQQPGQYYCRLLSDGPAVDFNKLSLVLHSVISAAHDSIYIITPYFIPSRGMIAVLLAAAHRGVHVTIVLPEKSNLRYIDWATRNLLWELLQWNIEVRYQPAPFDHSKLIVIDDKYVQIGSANIDPRSLRLNFELMVEVFHSDFASTLMTHVQKTIKKSRAVTYQEVEGRSVIVRIRDSLAWLLSPYL